MNVLEVDRLSKVFGGVQALSDVSFSVPQGQRLVLIGPNGAGKSTLVNVLNGQLSATTGRITLLGREVTTMAVHERLHLGLGRSFQLASLFLSLSVLHNVLLALQGAEAFRYQMFRSIFKYAHLFAKARQLLEPRGLWEKRNALIKELSNGEQRQMEIILSIACGPKVLLLDEPSSGLTAGETAAMIDTIRNLQDDITVLIVAHDMDVVFSLADRIIVLHYGQIIADGTGEEIQANAKVKEIYMGLGDGRASC